MDLLYVEGVDYLLLVDYLTKWPVVKKLARGTRSEIVIDALREAFTDFGQPDRLVSDNGPQFASVMFKQFWKSLNIVHVTSFPLHPSGNGQSERTIGTVKAMMKKCMAEGSDWLAGLRTIRNTPVGPGLPSPADLLQGRVLRDSHLVDVNRHKVHGYDFETVRGKLDAIKSSDKYYHNNHAKSDKETLKPGQNVYVRSAAGAWVPGKIVELVGERSYTVQTKHTVVRRNRKDIRPCGVNHNFQPSAVQSTVDAQHQSERTDHGFGSRHMGSDPVYSSSSSVHAAPREADIWSS